MSDAPRQRGWRRLFGNQWLQLGLLLAAVSLGLQAWQGQRQQHLGEQVAAAAAPGDLRMISSLTCGVCTQARRWFTEHEVAFSECFVERDAACRAEMEMLQAPGTPVIVVRGRPQLGFSPRHIADALGAAQPGG
jgi:glutaredoxin